MKKSIVLNLGLTGCVIGVIAGCASTKVTMTSEYNGPLPNPARILVNNFAVSPDEVRLDRGFNAKLEEMARGTPRTQQEIAIGRQVVDALARSLVKEIQNFGIPVDRASGPVPAFGNILAIEGQFISINQGNRTERVVIGLGAGRTEAKSSVQVFNSQNGKELLVQQFETDAMSGRKPGAAETLGVGAAAGMLGTAAVVTGGTTVLSETLGDSVEADAARTAKQIADKLEAIFVARGWTS